MNPIRDMEIIQTELRLKDIEWVEKALEHLKKTARALGSNSLADKARKEEIVSCPSRRLITSHSWTAQAITERILKTLTEDSKDVRKVEWNNREVREKS